MFLSKLEVQGFKTFAKKTSLSFLPPSGTRYPLTSIVGPNGSGKSNLADAIRWVLGEQSMKLLRGKKSEDVIFSGSEGRGRSGFAEVSITLNNEDKMMPIDYSEVTITRRLYRDGNSEYLLNEGTARLADIQLLLAQANVGQRSYSVIGQGMIDHILVSTPEERKSFFDDATGVKPLQLKRHEAILKLKRTLENLTDVEMLVQEIEPRLRSLKRQVSRLSERAEVEKELRGMETSYFGTLWWQLVDELSAVNGRLGGLDAKIKERRDELEVIEKRTSAVESSETGEDAGLAALQKVYREKQKERDACRHAQFQIEKEIELTKVRAQSNWAPLPLSKIVEEIDGLDVLLRNLKTLKDLDALDLAIDGVLEKVLGLNKRLKKPNPEDIKPDPVLLEKKASLNLDEQRIKAELTEQEKEIDSYAQKEKQVRTELIDMQRELREKQNQIHALENERNGINIEAARFEERQKSLMHEMDEAMSGGAGSDSAGKDLALTVRTKREEYHVDANAIYPEIQRLRYKLELIGGIDPEIVTEYEDTKKRFEFLDTQVEDLKKAIHATEKIVLELDEDITAQSKKVFVQINKEFEKYFKILFGGGTCSLIKLTKEDLKADEEIEVTPERVFEDTGEGERDKTDAIKDRIAKYDDGVVGIDIQATPPGKKLKSLNLLSGGERALTSIALLSAIMAVNPAPFVVLDEVDAALDESNTLRFASILDDLSMNSQFIVVTHNRATMEKADILYGVTMGDDGISNLLSVKLEDVANGATARR
jgi:chromosome segregation ATPase